MTPPDPCLNYCSDPFVFPQRPDNRPALSHIRYRVGEYADLLEAMFRRINIATELQDWTHRQADDPAVAIVEGAAIVGHILMFYQEHYVNEAFLRTASWRESIAELVRLLGYRLAPGLGGRTTFAFTVKGPSPITMSAGFPIKVDLKTGPADFQTESEQVGYPQLNSFQLYRPRHYSSILAAGSTQFELAAAEGDVSPEALKAVDLKKGDRLMLMPDDAMWAIDGATFSRQQSPQFMTVSNVTTILNRVVVEIEGKFSKDWTVPVSTYRIGRSFRHFGHNAPATHLVSKKSGAEVTGSYEYPVSFVRHLYHACINHDVASKGTTLALSPDQFPLDQDVKNLSLGNRLVVQTLVSFNGQPTSNPEQLIVVRKIEALSTLNLVCGNISGTSALVRLDRWILLNLRNLTKSSSDIRDFQIHEVTSPQLLLRPSATFESGSFPSSINALSFYGTQGQVSAIAGRRLFLLHQNGQLRECVCTNSSFATLAGLGSIPQLWRLSFDRTLSPLQREDFDEQKNNVTVYGNLVNATQGKAEPQSVLGNGDNRLAFQTFKLPKAPLTYLLHPDATPPEVPELDVYVNGRRWTRVDSLFGHGPKEQIYIVREDADGNSYLQFGDGETGARLPSGIKNVTCQMRSESGAFGAPRPDASPSASQQLDGLDKLLLPGEVTGGSAPESQDKAREAAPGRVQSLGRIVSLLDYETETLALAGVTTVSAAWAIVHGAPGVLLRVLMEAGREQEFNDVRDQIAHAQICRGPDRYPVIVQQAYLRYVFLDISFAGDPALMQNDLENAIRAALGLAGNDINSRTGLFGLRRRRLGEKEYAIRVEGIVQNVPGVLWCKVSGFGRLAFGIDPTATPFPPSPRPRHQQVTCPLNQLLQLHPNHLTLTTAAVAVQEPCT